MTVHTKQPGEQQQPRQEETHRVLTSNGITSRAIASRCITDLSTCTETRRGAWSAMVVNVRAGDGARSVGDVCSRLLPPSCASEYNLCYESPNIVTER